MEKNLTQGSVLKNIFIFSLPYLFSCFLQTLYGLADLFIAGQFNGAETITAVAVGSQIMHMVTVMIVGLAMGTTVLISRSVGAKDKEGVNRIIGNSVTLFFIVAALLTVILVLFCRSIVHVMSTPEEAVEYTVSYLKICFFGIPFIVAYNVIASVFRGLGDSKTPMFFVSIACVLNIILDYVFMGVLKLGASGAAWATVTAQAVSVVLSFCYIAFSKNGIRIAVTDLKPRKEIFGSLLKIGLPVSCQDGFIQISFLIITIIANSRGVKVAAAVGIVEKIICFLFLVPSSMLSAVSAISAQNMGAGEHERARKTLLAGISICVVFGLITGILFQFISQPFVSIFIGNKDAAVIEFGKQYLMSYVWDVLFAGFHFCFSGFFCAYGYSIISFIHNVCSILLVRIPGAWWTSKQFPETLYPMGWAAPLGSLLSTLICFVFFIVFFKKGKFNKTN